MKHGAFRCCSLHTNGAIVETFVKKVKKSEFEFRNLINPKKNVIKIIKISA